MGERETKKKSLSYKSWAVSKSASSEISLIKPRLLREEEKKGKKVSRLKTRTPN